MSEYVALPTVAGLLTGFIGNDLLVFTTRGGPRTVEGFAIGVLDAPSGASVDVELRTTGGALAMTLSIPDGANAPVVTTPGGDVPIQLAEDDDLFLRITAAPASAMGLFGTIQLNSLTTGVVNTGPDQDLTTDSYVLSLDSRMSAIPQTTRDAVRLGVSQRMVRWMGRRHVHPVAASHVEHHLLPGNDTRLVLDEWPANALTLKRGGEDVDASTFRQEGERLLRHTGGGSASLWPAGDYEATFDAGYPESPPALVHAAAWQTVYELIRVDGKLIGIEQFDAESGPVTTLADDAFLPSVVQAMAPFRNLSP